MNREQLAGTGPDRALEGRIESFELAFRMQAAPYRNCRICRASLPPP